MNQDINTGDAGANTPQAEEKTFSQNQLNTIVSKRLAEEKAKTEADIAKREQELQQREFLLNVKVTLTEKGLPVELAEMLNLSDPEAFTKGLEILQSHIETEIKKRVDSRPQYIPPESALQGAGIGRRPAIIERPRDNIREAMGIKK